MIGARAAIVGGVLALAVMSAAFTGQAIAVGGGVESISMVQTDKSRIEGV